MHNNEHKKVMMRIIKSSFLPSQALVSEAFGSYSFTGCINECLHTDRCVFRKKALVKRSAFTSLREERLPQSQEAITP